VAVLRGVITGVLLCVVAMILFYTLLGGAAMFGTRAGRAYADETVDQVVDHVAAEASGAKVDADAERRRRDRGYREWARRSSAESRNH
jgi:hypothetical protein